MNFEKLLKEVEDIINKDGEREEKLKKITELLKEKVPHYDWVGFYLAGEEQGMLYLGPFAGEPTEHVKIPFGKGICGQAAEREMTFIVQDVSKETNYLSCSPEVKSEIVVPIMKGEKLIGEIDIDSHQISPFTDRDRKFLERIAELVANLF